jgi:EF hand
MNTTKRFSIAILCGAAALGTSALALADAGDAKHQCEGKHGGKGAGMFKKGDKNSDGFLTKDEVGDKRWERIKLADANNDGKVSQPELQQARKDGKLPHGKKSPKA